MLRILWSIKSKADDKSKLKTPVIILSSWFLKMLCSIVAFAVTVEKFFLPPWWWSFISSFDSQKFKRLVLNHSSANYSTAGRQFTGLKLSNAVGSLFDFRIGIILDTFRQSGKIPVLIIELIKWAIIGAISGAIFLIILFEMAS